MVQIKPKGVYGVEDPLAKASRVEGRARIRTTYEAFQMPVCVYPAAHTYCHMYPQQIPEKLIRIYEAFQMPVCVYPSRVETRARIRTFANLTVVVCPVARVYARARMYAHVRMYR